MNDTMGKVMEALQAKEFVVEKHTVQKNNATVDCISVRGAEDNLGIVLYQDFFTANAEIGRSVEDIVEEILSMYQQAPRSELPDLVNQLDKDYILANAQLIVFNKDWNPEWEELFVVDDVFDTDLNVCVFIPVSGYGIIKFRKTMLEHYGIERDELLNHARENTTHEAKVQDISIILGFDGGLEMLVLTSKTTQLGAAVGVSTAVLDEVCDIFKTDKIVLLPSSIHEMLAVPYRMWDSPMGNVIQEVNDAMVGADEQLSDHPYFYDCTESRIWQ